MQVTFEGSIHEILDQIEDFCSGLIKTTTPAPKKAAKPKFEHTVVEKVITEPTPCQGHAVEPEAEAVPEDLLGAVMALVNGDKAKKDTLVKILSKYEAKTIGTLGADNTAAFWAEAKEALA